MNILITGASSGIGFATALELITVGQHHVLAVARSQEGLEALRNESTGTAGVLETFPLDVTNKEQISEFMTKKRDWLENIDVLINSAGLALGVNLFQESTYDELKTMVDTNIVGLCEMTRQVVSFMIPRKTGHIIMLGSIAGVEAYKGGSIYCATKAAVHMFTEGLRRDLGGTGVRVSNVEPGKVETNFSLVRFNGDAEKAAQAYRGYRPLQAADIANTIRWIIDQPPHVNLQQVLITATDQVSATEVVPV